MKKLLLSLLLILSLGTIKAQNLYNYGFGGVTADLGTAGWTRTNQSTSPSATLWTVASYTPVVVNSTATPAVRNLPFGDVELPNGSTCPAPNGQAGGANSFAIVNFTSTSSTATTGATISNWLISPDVTVQNGDIVSFYTRLGKIPGSAGAGFPDRLQLRMSTNGAFTQDPTLGPADVGDFTLLLVDVNPTLVTGVYPQVWTQYSYTIEGLSGPTECRFGFRYFVTNGGTNGANSDIIGVDTFTVDRPLATDSFFSSNYVVGPNPATDFVSITAKNNDTINTVEITDVNGRIVKNVKVNATTSQINMADLNSGVYFLKVSSENGVGITKIIKE